MSFFTVEAVASLLNKTPGEITAALKESDDVARTAWLSTEGSAMVAKLKEESTGDLTTAVAAARQKGYDEGHGRAKRETLTNAEKKLRADHEVDGENLEQIVANIAEKNRKASSDNPDDVKNSPTYIEMENNYKKRVATLTGELDSEKSGRSRDLVMSAAKASLESKLQSMNFILPEDAVKRTKRLQVILSDLEDDDTFLGQNDKGEIMLLDKDGRAKQDMTTMQPIKFDDRLSESAAIWLDVQSGDGKSGTGNQKPAGSGSGGSEFDFSHIKDDETYLDAMGKIDMNKEPEKLEALETYYKANVEAAA